MLKPLVPDRNMMLLSQLPDLHNAFLPYSVLREAFQRVRIGQISKQWLAFDPTKGLEMLRAHPQSWKYLRLSYKCLQKPNGAVSTANITSFFVDQCYFLRDLLIPLAGMKCCPYDRPKSNQYLSLYISLVIEFAVTSPLLAISTI